MKNIRTPQSTRVRACGTVSLLSKLVVFQETCERVYKQKKQSCKAHVLFHMVPAQILIPSTPQARPFD